jgi:hypothetical protein
MKRHPPDSEDLRFTQEVNAKLLERAARIDLHSVELEGAPREYKLVMSCGGHRHTVGSESPFCFAGEAEIIGRVERWLGTLENPNSKWTDDPSFA